MSGHGNAGEPLASPSPKGGSVGSVSQEPDGRRWTIRKAAVLFNEPVDTLNASIVGPNTEPVEVAPVSVVEKLREALRAIESSTPGTVSREDLRTIAREALASSSSAPNNGDVKKGG